MLPSTTFAWFSRTAPWVVAAAANAVREVVRAVGSGAVQPKHHTREWQHGEGGNLATGDTTQTLG